MLLLLAFAAYVFDAVLGASGLAAPFALLLLALCATVCLGVAHGWRWLFWVLLVAFLASGIAIPLELLMAAGGLPGGRGPAWYQLSRAGVSAVELALGVALLRDYLRTRRAWG